MTRRPTCFHLALLLLVISVAPCGGQEFDEKFEHWPVDLRIRGRLVLGSDFDDVSILRRAVGRISNEATVGLLVASKDKEALEKKYVEAFGSDTDSMVAVALAKTSEQPTKELLSMLKAHKIVCWHADRLPAETEIDALLKARSAFQKHIDDGGCLVAIGPVAKLFADFYAAAGDVSTFAKGLNLAPNCAIATGFSGEGDRRKLLSILAANPRSVGIGIAPQTAVVLSGRKMTAVGGGEATFMLMANERLPLRIQSISQLQQGRRNPEEFLVDLTEWRRDAIDRTIAPFPPAEPSPPNVENGTLVIVGGGGMPRGLMEQIVELAGGKEKAKMVYIPCSEAETLPERQRTVEAWKSMGVKHATFIHTKDRVKANTDEEFLAPLKDATGLWFGGGRQWNFADSYYGTKAHRLMKDVLKRGGVIGGSSAGASIQSRYLARATPIQNFKIMAPGYERGGLGFISGIAIDQHFSQRGRQKDMTQLVNRYPQMLGIGIDEATAIIVQKSKAEVVGRGKVHFYDRNQPVYPDRPDYVALPAGSTYDLKARKVLNDSAEKAANSEGPNEKKSEDK